MNVPVTNLKGLVTRSSSDILAVFDGATGLKGDGELNGCSEGWLASSVVGRRRWNCELRTRAIDDERKEMAGNSRPNLPRSCLLGRVGGRSWKLGRLIGCKGGR